MGELSFDNIEFSFEDTLLEDPSILASSDGEDDEGQKDQKNNKKDKVTELNVDKLFGASTESVGEEDNQEEEDDESGITEENRAANQFYSSIASALVDDGVLSSIDKESLKEIFIKSTKRREKL